MRHVFSLPADFDPEDLCNWLISRVFWFFFFLSSATQRLHAYKSRVASRDINVFVKK